MKFIIFVSVIAVVCINGHAAHPSDSQKDKATEYTADCVKESGVKTEVLAEARKGEFSEDDGLKKFILCFYQKVDIVDKDGKLNVATAVSKLPSDVDKTDAEKVLEGCKSKTGKDAAETTFEILKCYREGAKSHIFLGF